MKKALVIGILVLSMGGQAMSMGHPHNLFAARKTIRAKTIPAVTRTKTTESAYAESVPVAGPSIVFKRILNALVNTCQAQLTAL